MLMLQLLLRIYILILRRLLSLADGLSADSCIRAELHATRISLQVPNVTRTDFSLLDITEDGFVRSSTNVLGIPSFNPASHPPLLLRSALPVGHTAVN
jgi:hypothetical protein